MKLIIREFLASLKERDELDAILPDLLSEAGFNVYSRPRRGTAQHGVDVAAVGQDDDGERKIFLFSVKQGDLTRQDWDGSPQSLRPSLNEIRDAYIPSRLPKRYSDLKIVICLVVGGEIQEQVRAAVTGYINQNQTDRISFDEWNGDKLAEMLLSGVLREEVLPKPLRRSFRKAVAMVDEPDVSYQHFSDLVSELKQPPRATQKARLLAARQQYVCLWILYVWCRDANNFEAAYRSSELALLFTWELFTPFAGKRNKIAVALGRLVSHLIQVHLQISFEFLETKVFPHVESKDALSLAVQSRSHVDVNLTMFDLLGRISMAGLWLGWLSQRSDEESALALIAQQRQVFRAGLDLIANNSALFLPLKDSQTIEINAFLLLAAASDSGRDDVRNWLREMAGRLNVSVRTHGKYPCIFTVYRDLLEHPRERSDEYLEEALPGSILLPVLASWLSALGDHEAVKLLAELSDGPLSHCTLQTWFPDEDSENSIYIGGHGHGVALCDLVLEDNGERLLSDLKDAARSQVALEDLSCVKFGMWPILLIACRHYRHPIPAQFWIDLLLPDEPPPEKAEEQADEPM
jgi:hypothetical protein